MAGLTAVSVGGPRTTLSVLLTPTGAGTLVTGSIETSWRLGRRRGLAVLLGLVARIERRAGELAGAGVVVATAIVRGRTVLAQQRAFPPETAGRWELPGGRVEDGESDVDAVRRECAEELGVEVVVGEPIGPDVVLAQGKLVLRTYLAELTGPAEPTAREHRAVRWVSAGTSGELDWLPADRVLLPALRAHLDGGER